ncbi:OsmC family protein [Hyphobacterium sp. CCMP332]|nr:OsmC family protein [Hyphobacterium sp. CCMP332]
MEHKVNTKWTEGLSFKSDVSGFNIVMDAKPEVGGQDMGPSPKKLMLSSMTGCTGMDVISLLKKMRQEVTDFEIEAEARQTEEHPKHYDKIHITYKFKGNNLDEAKIRKAVNLSLEKYCGISYMLGKAAKIDYEIVIE